MLALLVCMLELLVGFSSFAVFADNCTSLFCSRCTLALCGLRCALFLQGLLWNPVFLILMALCGIVHAVDTPMLLAEYAMICICMAFLGDPVTE